MSERSKNCQTVKKRSTDKGAPGGLLRMVLRFLRWRELRFIRSEQTRLAGILRAGHEDARGVRRGIEDWLMEEALLLHER